MAPPWKEETGGGGERETWHKVYPLLAAMGFVSSICVFSLTRNLFMNPDVRVNKEHRATAVLENYEEGERYADHGFRRFLRTRPPEVYPLLAAMGFVSSICVFSLTRNLFMNPDVRVNKEHRATAVLENYEEGERYADHGFRRFLRTRPPEVMPAINSFFSSDSNK
ncbi:hypothetical protein EJ110_NYTH21150 [Nymphaea thermarum]|nr:hypothetical protein EJ110_NYTH21150 [Nymphaea thermarum]